MRDACPVAVQPNACVQLRSRYAECGHCEEICPTRALTIRDGRIEVTEECMGCGRCMAACPTGALQVQGFLPKMNIDPALPRPVRVDCLRAPAGADIRVPCLGGLSMSRLLALRLAAGPRKVELLDRGWCASCPASSSTKEHPAAKSLARAVARLRDAGLPEELMPTLRPLPTAPARPVHRLRLGRRRFLGRLAPSKTPAIMRFRPAAAPDRELVLRTLGSLAARHGGKVSDKLFHRVAVGEGCCAHAVCSAGCPTGALRLERKDGAVTGLSHSSELCVACGHCERACPEKALRLDRGAGYAPRVWVARFEMRQCGACGADIAHGLGKAARTLCVRCEKSSALARSAFRQFHAQGPGAALEP